MYTCLRVSLPNKKCEWIVIKGQVIHIFHCLHKNAFSYFTRSLFSSKVKSEGKSAAACSYVVHLQESQSYFLSDWLTDEESKNLLVSGVHPLSFSIADRQLFCRFHIVLLLILCTCSPLQDELGLGWNEIHVGFGCNFNFISLSVRNHLLY